MDTFLRFKLPLQRKGDNFRNDLRIKSRTHRCSPYFACTVGVCIEIKPDYKYRCNLLKTQHSSKSECNPEEHTYRHNQIMTAGSQTASQECQGVGVLWAKADHVAIVVKDVGRSLQFYTSIGMRQIMRPNFDR